jgi:hypothetical protein
MYFQLQLSSAKLVWTLRPYSTKDMTLGDSFIELNHSNEIEISLKMAHLK